MIKRVFIVLALIASGYGMAQEGTASPYSYYGIGELKFRGTMENQAMGGISVFSDSIHVNLQNPTSYADLDLTTYTVGGTYNSLRLQSQENKENTSTTSIDYLGIGIPLGNKLGMGFGILPYTSVGYQLESNTVSNVGNETNRFTGEGGINRVYLSFGYAINEAFSVGITGNYDFGKLQNETIQTIEGVQLGTREINRSDLSGIDFNLAVNYKTKLGSKLNLQSTVAFSPEAKISSENSRVFETVQIFTNGGIAARDSEEVDLDALGLKDTKLTLPMSTTFGVGIGEERKWFVGAEYKFQKISNFENPFILVDDLVYNDGYTFSFGGFYIPKYDSFNSYLSRVVYRAGLRYNSTGLEIEGEPINDFGISFGVGLPVAGFSNANLGFELGKRGTIDNNLVKENYFNIKLSLSFNDRWFVKRKYD